MLSRPVSCGWKPAPVAISPAIRPRVSTWPPSGRMIPLISLSSVLLPEPLRPISPIDSPCSIGEGHVVEGVEGVADLLAARGGHRHLLEGAVVAQRERLRDVLARRSTSVIRAAPGSCSRAGRRRAGRCRAGPGTPRTTMTAHLPQVVGDVRGLGRRRVVGGADPERLAASAARRRRAGSRGRTGRPQPNRSSTMRVGVDHRHAEAHEVRQDVDRAADVAHEHVGGAEQQRDARCPSPW